MVVDGWITLNVEPLHALANSFLKSLLVDEHEVALYGFIVYTYQEAFVTEFAKYHKICNFSLQDIFFVKIFKNPFSAFITEFTKYHKICLLNSPEASVIEFKISQNLFT